ncbi:hypothetical protein Tco_0997992 [Tanacetum coccineum]
MADFLSLGMMQGISGMAVKARFGIWKRRPGRKHEFKTIGMLPSVLASWWNPMHGYSAFKIKELKQDKPVDPKALLFIDSMLNWSDHKESADENASQVYGMIAGRGLIL